VPFQFDDNLLVLLRSGDIAIKSRNRRNVDVLGPPFSDQIFGSPSNMWRKFGDNRPSDHGDYAVKTERKKTVRIEI